MSEAEWKLPTHVLLRESVRHLFRSAQAEHDDATLETVLAKAQIEVSTYLMPQIVQVINNNKQGWFGHVMRREEESMLRVMMQFKMNGKRPRGDQD